MANGPMGGFMPTPPAPAQPPQVKLDTTATSRGNFSTVLKNMNGANLSNPPSMAPSVGAATPTLAPTMSDIDVFNPPVQNFFFGGSAMSGGGFSDAEIGSQIDDFDTGDSYDQGGEFSDTNVLDSMDDQRDFSDFSTDINALADLQQQADKGSFPGLDTIPGTFGIITGLINAATKTGAQNTLRDISRGFTPTYDSKGNITGTTNYGIGMGQPGGLFGGGKSVSGYDVFDQTSPSIGMYDTAPLIDTDNNDDPLLRKLPIIKEEEEEIKDKPPNQIGGIEPITGTPTVTPTVVASPFAPATSNIEPIGFDSGELNKLIELLTGVPAKPVVSAKEGGLIKAVDDFLATGT